MCGCSCPVVPVTGASEVPSVTGADVGIQPPAPRQKQCVSPNQLTGDGVEQGECRAVPEPEAGP